MLTTAQWIILAVIVLYMGGMVAIGFLVSKKNKTAGDFFLGGRKLGPLVTAMSAEASDMSGWLLMGLPAVALMTGVPEAFWTALGLAVGTYLNWLFVSSKLRRYSHRLDAFTLPDFFYKRFGGRALTVIAAVLIVVFFVPYTASGFAACGKLFAGLFGMDYVVAMSISAIVIVTYCTLGGFLAASTTDLIQSIVMTIALVVVLSFSAAVTGGMNKVIETVTSADVEGFMNIFRGFDVAGGTTSKYGALAVFSTLAWGLGYFGMPHILLRFMAIEDENKLKVSRRIATVWVVISMGVAVFIGVVGYVMRAQELVPKYADATAAETIIVDIANMLAGYGFFPAVTGGLILSGILASTMSTADSQLLAAASSISQNLLVETIGLKLNAKQNMIIARLAVIVLSAVAVVLGLNPNSSVFKIVSFAWAGFGAAFGPVVLLALFWRRANKYGAFAGMLTGGGMVFFWKFVIRKAYKGTILDFYELLPAFLLSLLVNIVVSLCTKKPEEERLAVFDEVKANK